MNVKEKSSAENASTKVNELRDRLSSLEEKQGMEIDAYLKGNRKNVPAFMTAQTKLRDEMARIRRELKKIQDDD